MFELLKRVSVLVLLTFMSNAFASPTSNTSEPDNRKVEIKPYKWFGESRSAKHVRIINPFGNITSRTSNFENIEMSGVIQLIGDKPGIHKIDIIEKQDVTEIVVSYPNGIRNAKGQLTGRFDLGVWLPSWAKVEAETDFGDIKIKRSASDVIARSNTGKIAIGTMGFVDAYSKKGDITIDLYNEAFTDELKAYSESGSVKVYVPQQAHLKLNINAEGKIKHNFAQYDGVKFANQQKGLNATIATAKADEEAITQDFTISSKSGEVSVWVIDSPRHNIPPTPSNLKVKKTTKTMSKQASTQ